MIVVVGAPGSGKTATVIESVSAALASGRSGVRLLVPTATMAQHLTHELARRGLAFYPRSVSTLSGWAAALSPEIREAPEAALRLAVEDALDRRCPSAYHAVADLAGFRDSLTRRISELASAGCVPGPACGEALEDVWRQTSEWIHERGWLLRHEWLARVAGQVLRHGAGGTEFFLDGFVQFSAPEIALLTALGKSVPVVVTLSDLPAAARAHRALLDAGFEEQRLKARRPPPRERIVEAPSQASEVDEVARAILGEAASGRRFRDIAVIVRARLPYAPALETAFERFGIPARFYFGSPLESEAVVRSLAGIAEASLQEPGHAVAVPAAWVGQFQSLVERLPPAPALQPGRYSDAVVWRRRQAAIDEFRRAVDLAASSLPGAEISARVFWQRLRTVLHAVTFRFPDPRRDVVHVMDAFEARQWTLPVVFVCGLVDGEFPRHHGPDPILSDDARRSLALPASTERQHEEQYLFDLARTRATELATLSYPKFDARGNPHLPSFFLELDHREPGSVRSARAARPAPRHSRVPARPAAIRSPELIESIRSRHAAFRPTWIESFLQCPFQFFGRHTLALTEADVRPAERLDFRQRGIVVHRVLEQRDRDGLHAGELKPLFERIFQEKCRELLVADGFRKERVRLDLLRDLQRFERERPIPEGRPRLDVETYFELPLTDDVRARGRIDRVEMNDAHEPVVIDYKYSSSVSGQIKDHEQGRRVQGGLYVLAARRLFGREPAGMYFVGLRDGVSQKGWTSRSDLDRLADLARRLTINAAAAIRAGRIEPAPADPDLCRNCELREACRVESAVASSGAVAP